MTTILFAAGAERWETYKDLLPKAIKDAGIDANIVLEADPEDVEYIIYAPGGTIEDFTPYENTKAVLSLWAGVEKIITNPTLTQPLARMVDPDLSQGMAEYVVGHIMRYHLGMDKYIHGLKSGDWSRDVPPLASERTVTILGLGTLGQACAKKLVALGFNVVGWNRSKKRKIAKVNCLTGEDGLREALHQAEFLVLLLPQTPETNNLMDAEHLALLPPGAVLINPGRGSLIDDSALLNALNVRQVNYATLDVFRREPLQNNHPYWAHPRVTVTPHIAAETRPESAAAVIAENIRRCESGEKLRHLVDRQKGY